MSSVCNLLNAFSCLDCTSSRSVSGTSIPGMCARYYNMHKQQVLRPVATLFRVFAVTRGIQQVASACCSNIALHDAHALLIQSGNAFRSVAAEDFSTRLIVCAGPGGGHERPLAAALCKRRAGRSERSVYLPHHTEEAGLAPSLPQKHTAVSSTSDLKSLVNTWYIYPKPPIYI